MPYWRYNEDKNVIERVDDEEIRRETTPEFPFIDRPRPEHREDADTRMRQWSEENKL